MINKYRVCFNLVFHEEFRLIGLIDIMTSNLIIKNACLYNLTSVAINSQYTSLRNEEKSQQQQKNISNEP